MIRHPRTLGPDRPRALGRFHALAAARPRAAPQGSGRTTRSAASGSCSARTSCPRCSGRTSSSSPTPIDGLTPRHRDRRRPRARGRLHHLRHRLPAPPTSCSRWRSPAATAARCARPGRTARTRTSGSPCPGFPSLFLMYGPNTNTSGGSIIVYLEAQAGYIRQALGSHGVRRGHATGGRGRERPRATGAVRRHRLDALRLLVPRRRTAGSSTNWPGYMREYAERTRDARSRATSERERSPAERPARARRG